MKKQKKKKRKRGYKMPPKQRMSPQQLGFQGRATIAPNILPGVKHEDLNEIACNGCGGKSFHPVHQLKVASRFQSVNGMPTLVQIPMGFACDNCNKVNPFSEEDFEAKPPEDQKGFGTVKKTEDKGDLGISVAEDVKTKDKPGA